MGFWNFVLVGNLGLDVLDILFLGERGREIEVFAGERFESLLGVIWVDKFEKINGGVC